MNKHLYRIVFNAKRGLKMAVSETTTAQGKDAGETSIAKSGSALALAITLATLPATLVQAQIIADPNAPRNQQAVILTSGNGVPVVNIQTPTAGGVSMNQFSQFNVQNNGAILNNGRNNVQTQLGGWIMGNPYLASGAATLIVNQINSNNPTLLNGAIEVAGQRAGVVIANPTGISVNGVSFINAQSATLTTGTPNFNGNTITGYTVNQGTVSIGGTGLDFGSTDYATILARAVQVNAGIWAKNLTVVAGANQINQAVTQGASPLATGQVSGATAQGTTPTFAIDVAALGGMYAGKIFLIGTEAGLGVRNSGTIMGVNATAYAGIGQVVVSANGMLTSSGNIQSAGDMSVNTTGGITNTGVMYAGSNSNVTTQGSVSNTGVIAASGNLDLTATGAASTINSTSGSVIAAGLKSDGTIANNGANLNIQATNAVALSGQNLAPNNINVAGTSINVSGSNTYGSNISATASTGAIEASAAKIAASQNLILTTPTALTTDNANVSAAQVTITANNLSNRAGQITHTGNGNFVLNLPSTLDNTDGRIAVAGTNAQVSASSIANTDGQLAHTGTGQLNVTSNGAAENTRGTVYSAGNLTLSSTTLTNTNGTVASVGNANLNTSAISSNGGLIQAGGNLSINTNGQLFTNTNSGTTAGVLAGGNLTLITGAIDNSAGYIGAANASINTNNQAFTNTGGNVTTSQKVNLTAASLTNTNGQVQAGTATISTTGDINNAQGLIRTTGAATLTAANINNSNTRATNKGVEAGSLNATVTGTYNNANGSTKTTNDLTITAPTSINNAGATLSAGGNLTLADTAATTGNNPAKTLAITNTGSTIVAGKTLTIDAATITGDGNLNAGSDLNLKLSGSHTLNNGSEILSNGNTTITVAGTMTNRGLIDGVNTTIVSGNLNNLGTGRIYGDNVAIQTGTLTNDAEGGTAPVIAARNRLDIGAATVINNEHALLFSGGDMSIGGSLNANRQATGTANLIRNASATIEATGNLSLSAASTENLNNHFTVADLPYGSPTSFNQVRATNTGNVFDVANLTLAPCVGFSSTCYNAPSGEFIQDYTLLQTTRTQIKTQVTSSDPGKISVGKNLTITGGDVLNSNSTVTVGGNLVVTGRNVVNQQASGNLTSTYSGTATVFSNHYEGGLFGCKCSKRDINGPNPYTTMDIQSINLSAAVSLYNTAPSFSSTAPAGSALSGSVGSTSSASGAQTIKTVSGGVVASTAVNTKVSNNSLFKVTTSNTATYLIETDPRFANYKTWLSSDYLLTALSYDPITTQKRLGDGFYEQKLVREQVAALTGNRFLGNYTSDEEEYKALMNNAITAAKEFKLRPGIALTAEQVAQLTSDIVWLVETEVVLPDGTKTKALVPQVYVRLQPSDLGKDGQLLAGANKQISANNIQMALTGNLTNTGTIAGRNLVLFNATNINNLGGSISGNNTLLIAKNDINNIGGSLSANNTLSLSAGGNININSTTVSVNVPASSSPRGTGLLAGLGGSASGSSYSSTSLDRVAALYGNNIQLQAGGDISLLAAKLQAGQNIDITGGNVTLGAITNSQQQYIGLGGSNYINQSSSTDIGSTLGAGGNLNITARKEVTGVAATLNATGNVSLDAVGSVTLLAGRSTSSFDSKIETGSSGIGNRKESIETKGSTSTATGTSVTGNNVAITSQQGNIVLQAANIEANQTLSLNATNGAVALLSATNQNYFQIDKKGSDFALQRMSGSGNFDQTTTTTNLKYGTLSIDTNKIIADLPASKAAEILAKQPGMGWINDIKNDPKLAGKIDWKSIDEAHKNWAYDKTTMTPAMASLVTIALAVATGGTGATLVGATAGSMGAAVASAAFTSLVTQATIGLINNGGDLSKTLSDLGSSESIRGLVTSMATAAAMSYVSSMDFMKEMTTGPNGLPVKFADLDFTQKLGVSVTNAATGAVTRTALNGGSLGDALVSAIGSGFTTALAAQGANMLHLDEAQKGDLLAQVGNKLGHALIGCAAAKANSSGKNCEAGATGAVIGEVAAEMLAKTPAEVDAMNPKERQAYESSLVNTTKLISASIAAAAGLDPTTAAIASANAVENNHLFSKPDVAKFFTKPGHHTFTKQWANDPEIKPFLSDDALDFAGSKTMGENIKWEKDAANPNRWSNTTGHPEYNNGSGRQMVLDYIKEKGITAENPMTPRQMSELMLKLQEHPFNQSVNAYIQSQVKSGNVLLGPSMRRGGGARGNE